MQSEFLLRTHLMCLNCFDAYMAAIRLPSDVSTRGVGRSLATMAGDAAFGEVGMLESAFQSLLELPLGWGLVLDQTRSISRRC
jgi:hypothetical protein